MRNLSPFWGDRERGMLRGAGAAQQCYQAALDARTAVVGANAPCTAEVHEALGREYADAIIKIYDKYFHSLRKEPLLMCQYITKCL